MKDYTKSSQQQLLANSFLLSADMGHAVSLALWQTIRIVFKVCTRPKVADGIA
jgi:hypothetical protein